MKAKNKRVGDIYLNTLAGDLWVLNKIYDENDKYVWTLNLINNDYKTPLSEVKGFIKLGNIYDMINDIYGEEEDD
jgi:hypothetical protein